MRRPSTGVGGPEIMAIASKNFASIACRDLAGTATCLLIASGKLHPVSEVPAA